MKMLLENELNNMILHPISTGVGCTAGVFRVDPLKYPKSVASDN